MKAKPIILIVVTLLIGFVLGMLTSAQLRYHRLKPVRLYFSEGGFMQGFYRIIEPDEKQKEAISKILEKYGNLNSSLQTTYWKELDTNMKDFRKEIDELLTKEQRDKLKEMDERRQQMFKDSWRNRPDSSNGGSDRWRDRDRGPGSDGRDYRGERPPFPNNRPPVAPPDSTRR
jgi:hypothetical protein